MSWGRDLLVGTGMVIHLTRGKGSTDLHDPWLHGDLDDDDVISEWEAVRDASTSKSAMIAKMLTETPGAHAHAATWSTTQQDALYDFMKDSKDASRDP